MLASCVIESYKSKLTDKRAAADCVIFDVAGPERFRFLEDVVFLLFQLLERLRDSALRATRLKGTAGILSHSSRDGL